MSHMCRITDCTKDGVEVMPNLVLCRYHRKRLYHALCEIYHAEQQKKLKVAEARQVAQEEAGFTKPPRFQDRGSISLSEVSGGLPSLGKGQ